MKNTSIVNTSGIKLNSRVPILCGDNKVLTEVGYKDINNLKLNDSIQGLYGKSTVQEVIKGYNPKTITSKITIKTFSEFDLVDYFHEVEKKSAVNNFSVFNTFEYIEWARTFGDAKSIYVCLFNGEFENDVIVGCAELKIGGDDNPEHLGFNNELSGFYICKEFREFGYSSRMINEIFNVLENENVDNFLVPDYTEDGRNTLKCNLGLRSLRFPNIKFKG